MLLTERGCMECAEKERLVHEYEAATAKFSEAVGHLRSQIGTSIRAEYECLQLASDDARVKSEQAHLEQERPTAFRFAQRSSPLS
jgi:hypothetical protein